MLRNLARLGTARTDLVDVYHKQCRSVLELAVPAWTPGLTRTEINQLERVQKTACAIILGDEYKSYGSALTILKMETLEKNAAQGGIMQALYATPAWACYFYVFNFLYY